MRKDKITTLYDNTSDYEKIDETRDFLFEVYADDEGWTCKESIPESRIYDEIDFQNSETWRDVVDGLNTIFKQGHYLLVGTCGRWNGNFNGGKFIETTTDLMSAISHLDYIKFTDKNGHFYIDGYHHDGSDHYELKRLTKKGYEYADRYEFAHDRQLHNTLVNSNFYTGLPYFAKTIYGL